MCVDDWLAEFEGVKVHGGKCIVTDASVFMSDVPGDRSICDEDDVTAWMTLIDAILVHCEWIIVLPLETIEEVEKRLKSLLVGGLYFSPIFRLLWQKDKITIESLGSSHIEPDEAYIALTERLANGGRCSIILLVTCDASMYNKARRRYSSHPAIIVVKPSQARRLIA